MSPLLSLIVCLSVLAPLAFGARTIRVNNRCGRTIWIGQSTNDNGTPLRGGVRRLTSNTNTVFNIPDSGWAGRLWPKIGCNGQGQACTFGQSVPPCGKGGCTPPADTKVEFFFPQARSRKSIWYDISLVDGYSLPAEIIPSRITSSCVRTKCRLSLDKCPRNEANVDDLRVRVGKQVVACLSPCKKWNYPAPFGHGRSENTGVGRQLCCPTPPVTVDQCRAGAVVRSQYVDLVRRDCPTAYSYAYDDLAGLHKCSNPTNFVVNFC